jgi:hypothetical protein
MSLLRKSSLRDDWSLLPIIHTQYACSVGMSRARSLALLKMFHLNNNDAKAARVQPGFDHLWGCKMKDVGTVMSNKKEVLNKHLLENCYLDSTFLTTILFI